MAAKVEAHAGARFSRLRARRLALDLVVVEPLTPALRRGVRSATRRLLTAIAVLVACGPSVDLGGTQTSGSSSSSGGVSAASTTGGSAGTAPSPDPTANPTDTVGSTSTSGANPTTSEGEGSETGDTATTRCPSPLRDAADRLELANAVIRGDPDALVTIVQWVGYNDPFSENAQATLRDVLSRFGSDIRLITKQLPLSFQDPSRLIAQRAIAAEQQGLFWEYHDQLFAYEDDLDPEIADDLAQRVGLDVPQLTAALGTAEVLARLDADEGLFAAVGATGTPSFVINGSLLVGAQPFEVFEAAVATERDEMQARIDRGFSPCEAFSRRLDETLPSR